MQRQNQETSMMAVPSREGTRKVKEELLSWLTAMATAMVPTMCSTDLTW